MFSVCSRDTNLPLAAKDVDALAMSYAGACCDLAGELPRGLGLPLAVFSRTNGKVSVRAQVLDNKRRFELVSPMVSDA